MDKTSLCSRLRHICRLAEVQTARTFDDCQLLERFVAGRDEAAFAVLVDRHSRLVLGVCRSALGKSHDAEDACQATFLVLAQRAASIRKTTSLSSWLHGVATRVAGHLRRERARRCRRERQAEAPAVPDPADEVSWREVRAVLDEELERLPQRLRAPLILCYLEGRTRDAAAHQLGLSVACLHGRLERGRKALCQALTRRGVTLSAALLGPAIGAGTSRAALGPVAVLHTARAAVLFSSGGALVKSSVCTRTVALAQEVSRHMALTRMKVVSAFLCAGLLTGALGVSVVAHSVGQDGKDRAAAAAPPAQGLARGDAPFKDWSQSHLTGTVRDGDGKPINGAKVHLNKNEGPIKSGGNWFTGADGKYTIPVFVKPDGKAVVTEVIVSAKGFVQLRERFLLEEVVLLPGKKTEANFVLARGEVLSGKIDVPLFGKVLGVKPEDLQFAFVVRGPSFQEYFLTEKGGRFEVWVPKGTYTIETVGMAGYRGPPLRREKVPSGSDDLRVAPIYPRPGADVLGKAFDALWNDMDRNYSYFTLKKIDWKALKGSYRPRAVAAGDLRAFVEVLTEILGQLRDGHVWIDFEGPIATHVSRADGNYNRQAVSSALQEATPCGNFAFVGVTRADNFGALVLINQSRADRDSVREVVEFIRAHHDAPGFLVDLREANGGNELLAQEIARAFCNKDAVYARSKYRAGSGHDDFGPVYDRVLKAGAKPYTKPVVCLIGPRAVSSGEAFVQMLKCLPNVTTVGARTRGSSGNPRPFELPGVAVTVWYSRWVDLMPDGTPLEGAGIAPDVAVAAPPRAYEKKDPTWDRAVEVLRQKASAGRR